MTEDDGERAVRNLARMLVKELLADQSFRLMVKEVVLEVYLTSDKYSREGYVRTLLRTCRERGAKVEVNKCGGVIVTNAAKLTPALRDAIKVYRQDIIECMYRPSTNGHNKGAT